MNKFARPCWGGPCTEKGVATPGFCKCKADADEIERLQALLLAAAPYIEGSQNTTNIDEYEKAKALLAEIQSQQDRSGK